MDLSKTALRIYIYSELADITKFCVRWDFVIIRFQCIWTLTFTRFSLDSIPYVSTVDRSSGMVPGKPLVVHISKPGVESRETSLMKLTDWEYRLLLQLIEEALLSAPYALHAESAAFFIKQARAVCMNMSTEMVQKVRKTWTGNAQFPIPTISYFCMPLQCSCSYKRLNN